MKLYQGSRSPAGPSVYVGDSLTRSRYMLADRRDLIDFGPSVLEWALDRAGGRQLALALCADALGDDGLALSVYERFYAGVVRLLPIRRWDLTDKEVREMFSVELAVLRAERGQA
jgi:Family of unknown function (DUF6166)